MSVPKKPIGGKWVRPALELLVVVLILVALGMFLVSGSGAANAP